MQNFHKEYSTVHIRIMIIIQNTIILFFSPYKEPITLVNNSNVKDYLKFRKKTSEMCNGSTVLYNHNGDHQEISWPL